MFKTIVNIPKGQRQGGDGGNSKEPYCNFLPPQPGIEFFFADAKLQLPGGFRSGAVLPHKRCFAGGEFSGKLPQLPLQTGKQFLLGGTRAAQPNSHCIYIVTNNDIHTH